MPKGAILITGCSSGIGYDAAHALQKRGWRVFATCRAAEDVARLESEGLESYVLDVADEASVAAGAALALEKTDGALDALFNNAAHATPGAVEDLPRDALRAIFETNLFGQFDLINRVLPAMRARRKGRIVNNSSVLGFVGLRYRGAYCSTKFAMEGMTDVLRMELAGSGVHVSVVQPGPITTKIRENSRPHFERWIDWKSSAHLETYEKKLKPRLYSEDYSVDRFELPPAAVTKKLIHALEHPRPQAKYMITTPTYLMNGFRRALPASWLDRILRRN